MKDVEKTNAETQKSSKRLRRRKRKFNIYALVVILLVVTAGITISYTFLFNINEIKVSGESDMYSAEEIVEASGIREGDNLLRLDPSKSEQAILDKLLFVESAEVEREFPSSLEIKVTKCEPAYNISYDGGTLLVSKKGKILADNGFVTDGLPIIYGYEPAVTAAGKPVESSNQHKNDAFNALMSAFEKDTENPVSYVDMNDEFSINVTYRNGIIFRMGNWNDADYKLKLAEEVMNEDSVKGKKGYLTMVGTHECGFRVNKDSTGQEATTAPLAEQTTDIYGRTVDGEQNPEQKAIFEQYNNNNNNNSGGADGANGQQGGGFAGNGGNDVNYNNNKNNNYNNNYNNDNNNDEYVNNSYGQYNSYDQYNGYADNGYGYDY